MMPVLLKDLLPLIQYNDVRLIISEEDEVCLIRKDHISNILSEDYLNAKVDYIENEEEILDTVNIHIKTEDN